jgi:glycosyltransferase involved in cell wall biosynthesis
VRRSVLNVLPHPGGGGETYVDALGELDEFESHRVFLAPDATPSPRVVRGVARAVSAASRYDLVHLHGEIAAGLCLPLIRSAPTVVTFHGLHLVGKLDGFRYRVARRNLRRVVDRADATICVAHSELDALISHLGGAAGTRTRVIPNGVPFVNEPTPDERGMILRGLGIDHSVVALFAGSLDRRKDPLTPVTAAAALMDSAPSLVLLVAGEGPLRPTLTDLARRATNVRVLGQRSDVSALMAIADVFVLVSEREGLSFALLEAMANGCAPIVSNVPANVEAVGPHGVIVPFQDLPSFTTELRRLVHDRAETARIGARARERVRMMFSVAAMLEATRETYEDVLRERGSRQSTWPRSKAR